MHDPQSPDVGLVNPGVIGVQANKGPRSKFPLLARALNG
jgi:hypothetical protein